MNVENNTIFNISYTLLKMYTNIYAYFIVLMFVNTNIVAIYVPIAMKNTSVKLKVYSWCHS